MTKPRKENDHIIANNSEAGKKDGKITWGELKQLAEIMGIQDSDEIDVIDISWGSIEDVQCEKDEDFGWQIRL